MPAQRWAGGDRREQAHMVASTTFQARGDKAGTLHVVWGWERKQCSAMDSLRQDTACSHRACGRVWGSVLDGHSGG